MFVAVALRKESVDRKGVFGHKAVIRHQSLSARRAWIEKHWAPLRSWYGTVALRKESVDRKTYEAKRGTIGKSSLSARRAWIENGIISQPFNFAFRRSPQGERG